MMDWWLYGKADNTYEDTLIFESFLDDEE